MSERLRVETNAPELLAAAAASFGRFALPAEEREPLVLRIFKEDRAEAEDFVPAPETLTHRYERDIYLVGGANDMAAADGRTGFAVASVGPAMAANGPFVRYSFIEGPVLSMLIHGRGYFAIHACGIARDGQGIALVGPAGAGKSTLAVAAARRGLNVFAEDGVFVRSGPNGLEFWGLPWLQRILPDARRFLPDLAGIEPIRQPNGELKIEIDLDEHFPGRAVPCARPRAVVLLERDPARQMSMDELAPADVEIETVWAWRDHWTAEHLAAEGSLSQLPTFRMNVSGSPDSAVDQLIELFDRLNR